MATIECEAHPPAYSKLPVAKRSLGDLTLLAGSTLKLKATGTKDITNSVLHLAGVEQDVPMTSIRRIRASWPVNSKAPAKGLNGFSILMTDTDGMESRDSAVYRVDVLPDKVPSVRILYPDRKEELITRQATMLISFEAADDFEISKVRLKFKTDALDEGAAANHRAGSGYDHRSACAGDEWKIGDLRSIAAGGRGDRILD